MKFASNSNLLQVPPKFASIIAGLELRDGNDLYRFTGPQLRLAAKLLKRSGALCWQQAILFPGACWARWAVGQTAAWWRGMPGCPQNRVGCTGALLGILYDAFSCPPKPSGPCSADNIMKLVAMRMDTCETCEEEVCAFILRAGPRCCMRVGGGLACILFAGWTVLAARGTPTGWVGDSGLTATSPKPTFHLHPAAPLTHPTPPHPTTHPHSLTPNPACPS